MVRPKEIIDAWSTKPKLAATDTMNKYGEPDEGSKNMLHWNYRGPWMRITIENDETIHTYPTLHTECCTYTIQHTVPFAKTQQLAELNSSMLVDHTKGTVSVRSENEQTALLELNMAQQLLDGKSEHDVRATLAQEALKLRQGQPSLYAQQLLFAPRYNTIEKPHTTVIEPELVTIQQETASIKQEMEEIGERIKQLGERIKDSAQT